MSWDKWDGSFCPKRDSEGHISGPLSDQERNGDKKNRPLSNESGSEKNHPLDHMRPEDIERRSFQIITEELNGREFPPLHEPVVKRVIHTTADFSYADNLVFTHQAAEKGIAALRNGATIITDTNMALAGINKATLEKLGCKALCYMADPEVAVEAKSREVTRATVSMERAAQTQGPLIMAVGNAPTALIRLCELMDTNAISPDLIIAAPVGFVNVVESKEAIIEANVPAIVARGRKGGSNVAAAIVNALMYQITRKK